MERRPHPEDARASLNRPTPKGRALLPGIERAWEDVGARLLAGLDKDDRRRLAELVRRLQANLANP